MNTAIPRGAIVSVAVVVLIIVGVAVLFGVCTKKVEPGYVGIRVNQYGTQRGVEDFPLHVGRVWYNPVTEDVYKFPTFMQTVTWTKDHTEGKPVDESITFNSVEGAVINADISISYAIEAEKVPEIFVEFRKDADVITDTYMRARVRDMFGREASKTKVTDIFGAGKQQLLDAVKKDLVDELGPKGFKFDSVSFVGALRVDQNVANSINLTIQATQKAIEAENKVRESEAVAQQQIAEAKGAAESQLIRARADAEANDIRAKSITPSLLQAQALEKWDGKMPQVTGSGSMPFIQLPAPASK
jgi:regulator of protease activity HflC (stomatin/prohibitin superfamily)